MMPAILPEEVEHFFSQLRVRRLGSLLLDYDGTLAPFREDRLAAVPYEGVPGLIRKIMAGTSTRVVLISGRPADEVRSLLGLEPAPEIWGGHGMERLQPDGSREVVELTAAERNALAEAESWSQSQGLGDRVEVKSGSVAVHWRGMSESAAQEIRRKAGAAWRPLVADGNMALLEFDGGIELRSTRGNKGKVVLSILKELDPLTPVAYLGDDLTDEDAFRALADRGLSLLVRPEWRETSAKAWIRPPEELLMFLEKWFQSLEGER